MHKYRLIVFLLFYLPFNILAQTPRTYTSSEILLQMKKLNVLGSVLYIAAHPDDENTRLLSWLANEKLYRTAYLSITRGDGGQNLIGNEQGIELGLIRTQELLAARRIDGAEQFFTCAYDFGYSKSPDETMVFWDREKVLSDVVWVIRTFRPDIIITRFPTTGEGGHGHHTASAILAEAAFDAAGDPNRFPEQLKKGASVWKPKRLMWNTFNFGSTNTQKDDQFKLDVGAFNPLLGKSYGELAALSRSQHKSQGFGVSSQRGSVLEYFSPIRGSKPSYSLLEGIDISWNRLNMPQTEQLIDGIVSTYNINDPSRSVPDLIELYTFLSASKEDSVWLKTKLAEIQKLIALCAGLYMEASTSSPLAIQGDSLKVNSIINSRAGIEIAKASVRFLGKQADFPALQPNSNASLTIPAFVDASASVSQPYWLAEPMTSGGRFSVSDQTMVGKPENEPLSAVFTLTISGQVFNYGVPVLYKYTDPVKGEILQPLVVAAPVSLRSKNPLILKKADEKVLIQSELQALQSVSLQPAKSGKKDRGEWLNVIADSTIALKKDEIRTVEVPAAKTGKLKLIAASGEKVYSGELKSISYDHIPSIQYQKPAEVMVLPISLQTGNVKRVGYIEGAGDKVADALLQMGYVVEFIKEEDCIASNLNRFDAIVTGVRAYNTNDWLFARNNILMDYVKSGGNLLIQYNTNSWAGPVKGSFGPYPFVISRNRITDENSPVKFLLPSHPAFQSPNKISEKDFEGWVQERSIYHADKIDEKYQKILGLKDPGENEQDGSVIIGEYGKGNFIYTGLVFFRQLPAGVSGSYRFLANLLALPRR